MNYKYIVFSNLLPSSQIIRLFKVSQRECYIINNENDLRNSNKYFEKSIYLTDKRNDYSLDTTTLFTKDIYDKIKQEFINIEKKKEVILKNKIEDFVRRIKSISINSLKESDTVVFRDRENPNNVGKVSIKNNKYFINNREYFHNSPFIQNIRKVENVFSPEDYFLTSETGMFLYEHSSHSNNKIFKSELSNLFK